MTFPLIRALLSFPSSSTGKREYLRAINSAVTGLSKTRGQKLTFLKDYEFTTNNIHFESLTLNPSPTAILNILCKQFLHANVSAILYMMNYEQYGRSTASAQYFLQVSFKVAFNQKFDHNFPFEISARRIFGHSGHLMERRQLRTRTQSLAIDSSTTTGAFNRASSRSDVEHPGAVQMASIFHRHFANCRPR